MNTIVTKAARIPEFRFGRMPIWHHHHSGKMRLQQDHSTRNKIVIEGSAAKIAITKKAQTVDEGYWVDWEIIFALGSKVNGRIWMDTENLKSAFDLSDRSGRFGDHLLSRFGGDVSEQGMYIRYKDYLNIPGPGTGHDSDPNVSIELDDDMRNAVRNLIQIK